MRSPDGPEGSCRSPSNTSGEPSLPLPSHTEDTQPVSGPPPLSVRWRQVSPLGSLSLGFKNRGKLGLQNAVTRRRALCCHCCLVARSCLTLCDPGDWTPRLLCPWEYSRQER